MGVYVRETEGERIDRRSQMVASLAGMPEAVLEMESGDVAAIYSGVIALEFSIMTTRIVEVTGRKLSTMFTEFTAKGQLPLKPIGKGAEDLLNCLVRTPKGRQKYKEIVMIYLLAAKDKRFQGLLAGSRQNVEVSGEEILDDDDPQVEGDDVNNNDDQPPPGWEG